MISRLGFIALLAAAVVCAHGRADEIFVKGSDKSIKSDVKSESAKEVLVDKHAPIVGGDVIDIIYEKVKPIDLNLSGGSYKTARNAEKEFREVGDAVKRKAALKTAIDKYTETLKKMEPHKFLSRHVEYKVAILTYQKALLEQTETEFAQVKLQNYKTKHADSWQINHVMPLIAKIQMDAKDYKGAELTYQEMAEMSALPDDVRLDAELKVVQVSVQSGNLAQANTKLDALEKKAGGNALLGSRVKMSRAEILVGQKKIDEAVKVVQQVLKENNDKQIKALAHNTLGECLFKTTRYNEALWEFLWVDTVYNQDRSQRAKALYYLWQTFEQLNNAERAQECREALLNDPQFGGTEFQRLGLAKATK